MWRIDDEKVILEDLKVVAIGLNTLVKYAILCMVDHAKNAHIAKTDPLGNQGFSLPRGEYNEFLK